MRNVLLSVLAVVVVCLVPDVAHAGGAMPYETWLKTLQESITGPVAVALILIGLVGAGGLLIWGGEISTFLKTMVYVTLVACLILGASSLLQNYFGGNQSSGYSVRGSVAVVSVLEAGGGE